MASCGPLQNLQKQGFSNVTDLSGHPCWQKKGLAGGRLMCVSLKTSGLISPNSWKSWNDALNWDRTVGHSLHLFQHTGKLRPRTESPVHTHFIYCYSFGWLILTDQWLKCLHLMRSGEISMHSLRLDSALFFASSFINFLLFRTPILMRRQQHEALSPSGIKDRQY